MFVMGVSGAVQALALSLLDDFPYQVNCRTDHLLCQVIG